MKRFIARRNLMYALKGSNIKKEFSVGICAPFKELSDYKDIINNDDFYGCIIMFSGINEPEEVVYGMDSLQAINLASNVEAILTRLGKKYDIFWSTGEPYFDE